MASVDYVVEHLHELGLRASHLYRMANPVVPLQLKVGLFTANSVDNIDQNPSSTTAYHSFHGTGISLFQHQDGNSRGTDRTRTFKSFCREDNQTSF